MEKEAKELFTKYTNKKVRSISKIEDGISHLNFLINDSYVLRIPNPYTDPTLSFKDEKTIYNEIDKLGFCEKIVYFNEENGIKISKFIHNTFHYHNTLNSEEIVQVVKLIKKIRKNNIILQIEYDALNKLKQYKESIKSDLFINNQYEEIVTKAYIDILNSTPQIFSHNDLVKNNLLFRFNSLFLIDWEYASMNSPYFDLASFISENNLTNAQSIFFLKKYYGSKLNNSIIKKIETTIRFQDILFYYWALYLYTKRSEQIFKDIAKDKLERIKSQNYSICLL